MPPLACKGSSIGVDCRVAVLPDYATLKDLTSKSLRQVSAQHSFGSTSAILVLVEESSIGTLLMYTSQLDHTCT